MLIYALFIDCQEPILAMPRFRERLLWQLLPKGYHKKTAREINKKTLYSCSCSCFLHLFSKNGIKDACSTADCCPLLTYCPRHTPDVGPDMPQTVPGCTWFYLALPDCARLYLAVPWSAMIYLSTECHKVPLLTLIFRRFR